MKQSGIIKKLTRTMSSKSQIDLKKLIQQNFLEPKYLLIFVQTLQKIRHKCLIGS